MTDNKINITTDICPITYVKTRIALDKLKAGEKLHVHLKGEESLINIKKNILELGHHITEETPLDNNEILLIIHKTS